MKLRVNTSLTNRGAFSCFDAKNIIYMNLFILKVFSQRIIATLVEKASRVDSVIV